MNQEDCDVMLEKNAVVKIYPHGNPTKDCEGVARLIECVEVQETKERWLVQFKHEHRLFKRFLSKPMSPIELPKPPLKMVKKIVNGEIHYFYNGERTSRKSILGMERTSHSEIKHQYKITRRRLNK